MRWDKGMLVVTSSALLTLTGAGLLWCPAARAGSPSASLHTQARTPSASPSGESDLDDDRAEHWAVPGIAREERVQSLALAAALVCAGAMSARRRARLRGQKPHG